MRKLRSIEHRSNHQRSKRLIAAVLLALGVFLGIGTVIYGLHLDRLECTVEQEQACPDEFMASVQNEPRFLGVMIPASRLEQLLANHPEFQLDKLHRGFRRISLSISRLRPVFRVVGSQDRVGGVLSSGQIIDDDPNHEMLTVEVKFLDTVSSRMPVKILERLSLLESIARRVPSVEKIEIFSDDTILLTADRRYIFSLNDLEKQKETLQLLLSNTTMLDTYQELDLRFDKPVLRTF